MSLVWSATNNPATCTLNSSPIPISGSNTMTDTELVPGVFIIVCGDVGGGNSSSLSFRLNNKAVVATPVIVTLSSNTSASGTRNADATQNNVLSIPLKSDGSVTLTWSSQNATMCELNHQGLSQSIPLSGSNSYTTLVADGTIYRYYCFSNSTAKGASLYFKVTAPTPVTPAPTVTLTESSLISAIGESYTVHWNSQNADSCVITVTTPNGGVGTISHATYGTFPMTPASGALTGNYIFSAVCVKGAVNSPRQTIVHTLTAAPAGNGATAAPNPAVTTPSPSDADDDSDSDTEDNACLDIPANVVLRYRSKDTRNSSYVSQLQDFLNEEGYLPSQATGFYGAGTLKAVKAFQRANRINGTGSVGTNTKAAIKRISCGTSAGVTNPTCNSSQSLVNGVCQNMTHTCPNGTVIAINQQCTTAQNGGAGNAGSAATGVPVVTIKAKGYGRNTLGVVWTATNNPSYCTASDGLPGWAGVKEIPSTAVSYNQMLYVLSQDRTSSTAKYTITCTNNYGTSQSASVDVNLDTELGAVINESDLFAASGSNRLETTFSDSKYYPASWPASWKSWSALTSSKVPASQHDAFQLDDSNAINKYKSRLIAFIYGDADLKLCKSYIKVTNPSADDRVKALNNTVNVSSRTSFPCAEEADFVSPTQKNFTFGNPLMNKVNNPNVFARSIFPLPKTGATSPSYSETTLDGTLGNTELYKGPGRIVPASGDRQFFVYKASNGGVNADSWYRIGGVTPEENSALGSIPNTIPVTTLTAVSPAPNTVTLTWASTNDTTDCVAYKNEVLGWGSTILPNDPYLGGGVIKTAPSSSGSRSQTLTVATPGTYTFQMRCRNNYSFGQPAETTVTIR